LGGQPGQGTSAALLADGTHFVGGDFGRAADFDPGPGLDLHTPVGPPDAFVAKLNADGTLGWAKTFGADFSDAVTALAAGPDGSVVAVGHYGGTVDFDPGPGVDSHSVSNGDQEAFVMKLAADGSFVWARTFPSVDYGWADAHAVAVANDGSIYVGGEFSGGIDLDPGTGTTERHANGNAFLVKLTGAGSFVWGRALGGPDCVNGILRGLALSSDGSAWTTGTTTGACPFDPADPDQTGDPDGRTFVAGFAANGDYKRSWRFTAFGDYGPSITVASDDSIYVGATFIGSVDFDPGPGATQRSSSLNVDGFYQPAGYVTKFGQDGALRWVLVYPTLLVNTVAAGGNGILAFGFGFDVGTDIVSGAGFTQVDATGVSIFNATFGGAQTSPGAIAVSGARFVLVGQTDGLADFDPGPGTDIVDRGAVNFASRYSF
jgi:hypothetical protein